MKIFKILAVALVAMLGFTACNKECEHDFIDYDHSADIVGTWTCIREDFAEALVIKADGSVFSTGSVFGEEYWEDVKGNIVLENGNITMTFEDGDNFKGHFDIIPGKAFSIYNASGRRFTYDYCANDLADEIVGMWVCNDVPAEGEGEMMIETFYENGKSVLTGFLPLEDGSELVKNNETDYNVVGDLLFVTIPDDKLGGAQSKYVVQKLIYSPNGTSAGDIMTLKAVVKVGDQVVEGKSSWLRIKQYLELPGNKYDYIKTYVSNVKGVDRDVDFMGQTFNFSKMDGVTLDKMLKKFLFSVEFPDAEHIKYSCHYNNAEEPAVVVAPITVEGNKMTIKIGEVEAYSAFGLKDVDLYTFQDQDNTQMHLYMPTYSFINFFGNTQVLVLSQQGQLDPTDAAAVEAVYGRVDDTVESINLSLIMNKARK